eukprot:gene17581-9216_t
MPQVGGVQLLLLVLAVPTQYFISKWMTPSSSDREYMTRRLINGVHNCIQAFTNASTWKKILIKFVKFTSPPSRTRIKDMGECPAKEVFSYQNKEGYFASSIDIRKPRPTSVAYRVGQVIKHKKWGYRGVIVGWDERAKEWRKMPNYSVLVHTDDRSPAQITYIPQENFEILTDTKINHPEVEDYFEDFDGAQYVPRPWLKEIYPLD